MKKFVFSAVAMMAFSVSSVANTIDVELNELIINTDVESVVVVDCWYQAMIAEAIFLRDAPVNSSYNSIDTYYVFSAAYEACVRTSDCPSCLQGN